MPETCSVVMRNIYYLLNFIYTVVDLLTSNYQIKMFINLHLGLVKLLYKLI